MKLRIRIICGILMLLCLSGCGQSNDVNTAGENMQTEEPAGRYSDEVDASVEREKEVLAVPEVTAYSERELTLPDPVIEAADQSVTMMIYMIGSDLESKSGAATKDMEEMLQSGVDLTKVNLLLYTGGCEQWQSDIDGEHNCIYQLTEGGPVKLMEYNQQSMGDGACLSTFLKWTYQNYQTDSYNLILWDHGNGPVMGYGKDRLFDGDAMELGELGAALSDSPFNKENKLGFIGFDACLMSSAELACTVGDYADYLVASQEVEPNFGWDYSFLKMSRERRGVPNLWFKAKPPAT